MKVIKIKENNCAYCNEKADFKIIIKDQYFHLCDTCKHELTYELISN